MTGGDLKGTIGTAEIKTKYPIEDRQKQVLIEEEDISLDRDRTGLDTGA